MEELILEKVQPTVKTSLERDGLHIVNSPNANENTYFDFSGFDGLGYSQFKQRFLKMCKDMSTYTISPLRHNPIAAH